MAYGLYPEYMIARAQEKRRARAIKIAQRPPRPAHHETRFVKHPAVITPTDKERLEQKRLAKSGLKILYRKIDGLGKRMGEIWERFGGQNRIENLHKQYQNRMEDVQLALNPQLKRTF